MGGGRQAIDHEQIPALFCGRSFCSPLRCSLTPCDYMAATTTITRRGGPERVALLVAGKLLGEII